MGRRHWKWRDVLPLDNLTRSKPSIAGKILWAGGTLESRRDQAVIAALAPTSEKLFVFLGQPYVPFENNGWERGLLVVRQINANTPISRWPTANKAGDTNSYAVR
jgi:hypothetical protein